MEVDPTPGPSTGASASVVTSVTSVVTSSDAKASSSGSLSVALHPLVIMNLSEHWTRNRAQKGQPEQVSN